ncbi:MAG TPA: DUF1707 domain-containing protein [Aldersonia sp.]
MAEPPEVRIGTAERERALSRLSAHFSAGRLSVAEFDERSATVAAATTRGDLDGVFADLPVLEPETEPPKPKRSYDWRAAALALTPIAALVLFFVFDNWMWFLLIPVIGVLLSLGQFKRG